MIASALLYVTLVGGSGHTALMQGWDIPCATDIAFSYLVARLVFGPSHPAVPFLLLLAIADDALGLMILAAFYPSAPVRPLWFAALLTLTLVTDWWLRTQRAASYWPYILLVGSDLMGSLLRRRVASRSCLGARGSIHPTWARGHRPVRPT
jgi:NhaA family Na+:H+ antiporter